MQPLVAAFLFLAMAIGIYDHQDENNNPPRHHRNQDRAMLPNFGYQISEV